MDALNQSSASFTFADSGTYTVKGRIKDINGGFTDYTTTVTITNAAPTLTLTGPTTSPEGDAYTLRLASADVSPDTIARWTITWGDGSPPEVINGNPPSVTHRYLDGPNSYTISATATDEDGTYNAGNTIIVGITNTTPTLALAGAATAEEGTAYVLNLAVFDTGTDTISRWTITWGDGSPPEVINGSPAAVTHVYRDGPATHTISATATDEDGAHSAGNTVAITVNDRAPTVQLAGAPAVDEAAPYVLNLSVLDPGMDTISRWTINWGDGSPLQVVNGNPSSVNHTYADGDTHYTISATVTNEDGTYSAGTLTVLVRNLAPSSINAGAAVTIREGELFTASGSFTDPGVDTWTAAARFDGQSSFVPVAVAGRTFDLSHLYSDNGTFAVGLMVRDSDGAEGVGAVTVRVDNVAPAVNSGPGVVIPRAGLLTAAGFFVDPGRDLWSALVNYGDGAGDQMLALNPNGIFTLSHVYAANGVFTVTVRVTDDDGGIGTDTLTVTVRDANLAPVLPIIMGQSINEGTALMLNLAATDPNGDSLRYSLDPGAPAGAGIDSVSGLFTWTPSEVHGPGVHTITVRALDNGVPVLSSARTFSVTVNEVNGSPVLTAIGNQTVNEGQPLTFSVGVTDADVPAQTLTFSLVGAPAGATIHPTTGVFSWTPTEAQGPNVHTITVRVADNGTPVLVAETQFQVTINEVNTPPVVAAVAVQRVAEGGLLVFTVQATDLDLPANGPTFFLDGAPGGASIHPTTGAFTWTPTLDQGRIDPYRIRVLVRDGRGGESVLLVDVQVDDVLLAADVTSQVKFKRGKARFNAATRTYTQTVTIIGNSRTPIRGPLALVFDNLSVQLLSASGTTRHPSLPGKPYVERSVAGDGFLRRKKKVSVGLVFSAKPNAYTLRLLDGTGVR